MKPSNGNKRKMNQTNDDDDCIPGTPQEKHKKKQRKRSTKCTDCDGVMSSVSLNENLALVKDVAINSDPQQLNFDDLFKDIDFLDDFCDVQVSQKTIIGFCEH